jgi:hypothetical protein
MLFMQNQKSCLCVDIAEILELLTGQEPKLDTRAYGSWFHSMSEVARKPGDFLDKVDIGSLNIMAALGLPGTENLDVRNSVEKLKTWAKHVWAFTEDQFYLFEHSPEQFGNSLAHYRMWALLTCLQQYYGFRCNVAPGEEDDFYTANPGNFFIHDLLSGYGGSGLNMPILCLAIGRRLNYPLHLVCAKGHNFLRWEEHDGHYFNIECTLQDFQPLEDKYYRDWPKPISDIDLWSRLYFQNLPSTTLVAQFLCHRVQCLINFLRMGEALLCCFLASHLSKAKQILDLYAKVIVMAKSLELARQEADMEDYYCLDLRKVSVPDNIKPYYKTAAPKVRKELERIARISEIARSRKASARSVGGFQEENGNIVTCGNFEND